MGNENPSVDDTAISIGTELAVALAQRLVAIQSVCNSFLNSTDLEKCFAVLTDNLSAIETLDGRIPRFVTQQFYYYLNALEIIDDAIDRKKSEMTSFIQPKSEKLRRVRERLKSCGAEISAIVQPAKETAFRQHYEKFWRRELTDMSLINLRIQRYLAHRFPFFGKYASGSENFFRYCLIKKRHEILSESERLLSYISAEEKLIKDALDTLESIRNETRRLLLETFTEPLNELCDLLNRNYESVYEEFTVIVLHPSFMGMFETDGAETLHVKMDNLETLQIRIEALQDKFDDIEDKIAGRESTKPMSGFSRLNFCL
jgi:hypothetical protein